MPAPVLELDDISFAYHHDPVLEGVSFDIGAGELVALVGPNGSGKSTLLRIALGLLQPGRGRSQLFGERPGRLRDRGRLGYVPQRPMLAQGLAATVEDIVAAGRLARTGWLGRRRSTDRPAIDAALDAVDLLDLRRERVAELSGGQQQRTFIARALAGEPDLLVLDEPVAGVDAESQRSFRNALTHLVETKGGTVLLVSHELSAVADDLDRIIVLKRSIRFDGTPEELTSEGVSLGVHRTDLPLWLEGVV
ncbi:MAG TPA: metal ABC transporter ATP-binding protein [Acidimicrobiales bacterium]|nr:metal ABC transporter ATP-binding protein [Acidimicrobiales bacterium]